MTICKESDHQTRIMQLWNDLQPNGSQIRCAETIQRAINSRYWPPSHTAPRHTAEGREKGFSIWLNALPLQGHEFTLHKGAFCEAIAFRYSWNPSRMPAACTCGTNFSVDHAFLCAKGGFTQWNVIKFETWLIHKLWLKWLTMFKSNQSYSQSRVKTNSHSGARIEIGASGV